MGDKDYRALYKEKDLAIDKEFGPRYRTNEAMPGETYGDFRKRKMAETLEDADKTKVYPPWVKMPGESNEHFKRRLVKSRVGEPKKYSGFERMPGESEKDFKKRWFSRKVPKDISTGTNELT